MLQKMIEIILIKNANLPKQWNINNHSATADTVPIDVHVAGVGMEKTYIFKFI